MAGGWNDKIIEEFRANGGKVGGPFEGGTLLLLHSTGARTGREHVTPVMYRTEGDGYAIFASKGGAPDNPDWYHNVLAHPKVSGFRIPAGHNAEAFDRAVQAITAATRDLLGELEVRGAH